MNEAQLRQQFIQFLKEEKGFPTDSILVEAPIIQHRDLGPLRADLLIVDTRLGEYIALIEFKTTLLNPQMKKSAKMQMMNYLNFLKAPSLPAYLVTPIETEEKFNILLTSEGDEFINITKEEFPQFDTLSAKKNIEEKEIEKEEQEQKKYESIRTKKVTYWQALSVSFTLIAAIITTIITFYTGRGERLTSAICDCEEIETQINSLEKRISSVKINRTSHTDTTYVIDSTKTFSEVDTRLSIIEDGISNNPEKTLSLVNIKQEIQLLQKNLEQLKELETVRNENIYGRIDWLNALISGIVIAIFGAAIAFLLTSYYGKLKNTDNTH